MFIVISDVHYGNPAVQQGKPIAAFIARAADADVSFAVATGDLTDNGYDGTVSCGCCFPLLGTNSGVTGGGAQNQVKQFSDAFMRPIDNVTTLYLIQGNHDRYNGAGRYPIEDIVKKRHGNTYYSVVKNGILYLFCDVYPTADICAWIKTKMVASQPVIFFFHYNLQDEFSDWWTDSEKNAFAQVIAPYKVLGIFVGHYHRSYTYVWKGINVYSTAGDHYAECVVGGETLTVVWKK